MGESRYLFVVTEQNKVTNEFDFQTLLRTLTRAISAVQSSLCLCSDFLAPGLVDSGCC